MPATSWIAENALDLKSEQARQRQAEKKFFRLICKNRYIILHMWSVYEHRNVIKSVKKAPRDILVKYEAWKRIVEMDGPQALKMFGGLRDKALMGIWKGYRSSRLGLQWRIIYKVRQDRLEVYVFELNPHRY